MATLAESLEKIYDTKIDIKDALTEVGANMTTAKFDEYADIIDNGDGSLGTVLHRTSPEFKEIYKKYKLERRPSSL